MFSKTSFAGDADRQSHPCQLYLKEWFLISYHSRHHQRFEKFWLLWAEYLEALLSLPCFILDLIMRGKQRRPLVDRYLRCKHLSRLQHDI